MRTFIFCSLLILVALNAFGHAGEVHKYMGTVTAVHDDGSFMLKKTDGGTMHVEVSSSTVYQQTDGRMASRAELGADMRVVVTISTDGKTASLVKFAAKKK
jgi:hypothetical protein